MEYSVAGICDAVTPDKIREIPNIPRYSSVNLQLDLYTFQSEYCVLKGCEKYQ